ncbi:MAG: glycine cleavage system aminomethyltransferase GcvT [Candidatus Omnitrophica bacterium]|nr:glycine cleavage system aminomethyltransferase GcvT [Candidatus Omnitrophota bacterium]
MLEQGIRLKITALGDDHLKAGARMVPFAGWSMPLQYTGIIEEHMWVRTHAGLFDVSHMGEFMLSGDTAAGDLERLITCGVGGLSDGMCRYGFLLRQDAGIIDDLIVFRISEKEYMLVVNAGTTGKDRDWITDRLSAGTEFEDISGETVKLDLQGPDSVRIMSEFTNGASGGLKRFRSARMNVLSRDALVSMTGYTGEPGYEIFISPADAGYIWEKLLSLEEVRPIGLGARDTLRLEMGYSLYGNDIDEGVSPYEAGLMRFVSKDKDFIGKEALLERGSGNGPVRVLRGFICEGRRSARKGFLLRDSEGREELGEVTSGAFSPCMKKGIGMCYVDERFAENGRSVVFKGGNTEIPGKITGLPIYRPKIS